MDGISPVRGNTTAPSPGRPAPAAHAVPASVSGGNLAAVKTPAHYIRATRRRIWLVLAVAVPLAILASILTLRQPRIYQAQAEIMIEPPEYDPVLSTLVGNNLGHRDPIAQQNYVPNRAAQLRSKGLHELVVADPRLATEVSQCIDPAKELYGTLSVQQHLKSNWFTVTLEGKDPARTKKLLEALLEEFKNQAKKETLTKEDDTRQYAQQNLDEIKRELNRIENEITKILKENRTIGPEGKSIIEEQYLSLGTMLKQKQIRIGELHQQMMLSQMFPRLETTPGSNAREEMIARKEEERRRLVRGLSKLKHTARNFNSDPAAVEYSERLQQVMGELSELRSIKTKMASDPTEMILDQYRNEIEADKAQHQSLLTQLQDSLPDHQRYLSLMADRELTRKRKAEMERDLASFKVLSSSQKDPVKIPGSVVEPVNPIKPNRTLQIALGLIVSFGLGIGLVVLLEHIDHSVKVPEHVTHGLTLPLLGVVPRIRRTALTHRGGHLWTPGSSDSIEADAYRNIRASLLGVADRRGPIVTLLVTSAKAGEGKSTTALNLAATCARAGERTLLLDVDLRRPSLGEVFTTDDDRDEETHGLVDVLRGELPWQRTVRHTDLPNLDFIPTGDPRDIPIEILGTLELRQLLIALSHHYDRVILDGPAVLGLADCRMLGRIVDASVLVVRSGANQLMTLQRAKAMLEQSHVAIAGVVVNGLNEDLDNWSSYGYDPMPMSIAGGASSAYRNGRALESNSRPADEMMLAGSIDT